MIVFYKENLTSKMPTSSSLQTVAKFSWNYAIASLPVVPQEGSPATRKAFSSHLSNVRDNGLLVEALYLFPVPFAVVLVSLILCRMTHQAA